MDFLDHPEEIEEVIKLLDWWNWWVTLYIAQLYTHCFYSQIFLSYIKQQPDVTKQSALAKLKKRREEKKWCKWEEKEQQEWEENQGVQGWQMVGSQMGDGQDNWSEYDYIALWTAYIITTS